MLLAMLLRLAGGVGGVIIFAVTFELAVLSISPGVIATSQPLGGIISQWSNFNGELDAFLNDASGIKALQKAYDGAAGGITFKPVNGKQLVQEIAKSLGDLFSKRVQALQNAVKHAEKLAADYKWDDTLKKVDCLFAKALNDTIEPFAPDKLYDKSVSLENSSIHIPVDIFNGTVDILNSIAWTSGLDEVWKKNKEEDPTLVWQYFGSRTGLLRSYPATSWKSKTAVDLYDVRRSKWYTQGVSSPKDVLILIERSGSSHGQALQLIKHSVKSLIDTLSENDFVSIANFSDKFQFPTCFNTFVQATERNKKIMKPFVDDGTAGQVANYAAGFESAFQEFANFSEEQGASCNRIIMLFTDGTSDVPVNVFKKYNPDKKIRVFSYAVGPMAGDRSVQTKEIGCSNRGFYYPIPAMGAIRAQVQDYLTMLAPPQAMASGADKISWTSPHQDEMDMGLVLAVTMPVFRKANSSNNFNETLLGMMGVDVTLKELKDKLHSEKLAPNGYAFGLNPNGIVLFHPVLDNFKADIASASSVVDFAEIGEDASGKDTIRREMIDQLTNSKEITEFVTATDGKYDLNVTQTYHYTAIPGTNFSVAVVIPDYIRDYISEKRNVTLEEGIELLRTNESQLLFNTMNICKPAPLETNETSESESSESNLTLEELVELLSLNPSDCDAEALQKLLFDVMITSHLEDKWTGKERKKEERRDPPSYNQNHDHKRDTNGLSTNEPTRDQMQDSSDSATNDPTHYQMQDDSVTNDPTHYQMQDDSVTNNPTHDQTQDDSVTNDPTHDQTQGSHDLVTHDEKQDSNDLIYNETITDVGMGVAKESSVNRLKRNAVQQSMDVIYARFVTTGKDFSRVRHQSANDYETEEEKKELKTFMEKLHDRTLYNNVWIFALYPEGGKGDNASLIFASKTVSLENNYRAATVGVQFTRENFSDLVSNYESNGCNSLANGSVCYILDDGGFILSQKGEISEDSVGRFFGSVEGEVMKALIDGDIYEGRAHTNYQAICVDRISRSAGFRLLPPFIYEVLSLNWWTTATTWTYMNIMNIYSWLFTTQVPYVEAYEDIIQERACIKSSYQYHFGSGSSQPLSGDAGCNNCTRQFAASRLQSTNLLMVAIHGESCNCEGLNITFPSNEESDDDSLITRYSDSNCTANVRYRRKPPCHEPREPISCCGASSIFFTSHYHITLLVSIVLTKLVLCHVGDH